MEPVYVIAMDAHCTSTDFFITTPSGRLSRRGRTPTTLPDLHKIVQSVRRPRHVVFEEGPHPLTPAPNVRITKDAS